MAGFAVTISAVDKLSGALDNINRNARKTFEPFRKLGASTKRLMDVSGVTRVGSALRDVGRSARESFQRISSIIAPLGAISGAASVAGMYRMVSAWAEWGTQLGNTARNMGITAGALGNLQGAARLAGTSGASLTAGLQTLGQTMYDAVGGRNAGAVVMFNTLGVAFRKNATQARSVTDVLPELADKIASLKDPYAQAQAASTLFGGAAADMLPFLRRGSAGLREYQAAADRYLHITPQTADAANSFREAQTRLTLSVEGLGNRISENLAPTIAPLLRQFAEWIATSPQVTQGINALGQGVQRFADWLRGVNWAAAEQSVERWGGRIMWVTNLLGGPADAIRDLMLLMAGRFVIGLVAPWARLGLAIGGVIKRLFSLARTAVPAAIAAVRGLRLEEEAEAAAEAATGGGRFGRLASLAGRASLAIGGGIAAHEAMQAVDPNDRMGAWIDNHVPGAAFLDNAASHLGLGRSYHQQAMVRFDSATQQNMARQAMQYFSGQGWSPAQAAGIVASLRQESGFNPQATGDGGRALGIAQWHPDRQAAIERQFGTSLGSMSYAQQLAAVNWELRQGGERAAGRRLAGAQDALSAGGIVSSYYERPAADESASRGASAQAILADYQQVAQPSGPPMQVNSVSGAAASTSAAPAGGGQQNGRIDLHVHSDPGITARVTGTHGSVADARVVHNNVTGVAP